MFPPLRVRVVLFQESTGDGPVWIAQCLEHDIAAYGETVEEAKAVFERTVAKEIAFAVKSGRQNLAIGPAPSEFHAMWNVAEVDALTDLPIPVDIAAVAQQMPRSQAQFRLASAHH